MRSPLIDPYRPSMSDDEAVEILSQRRGRMYDPLVVDEFVSALPSLKLSIGPDLFQSLPSVALAERNPPVSPSMHSAPEQGSVLQSLKLLSAMAPFPAGQSAVGVARDALSHLRGIASFDTSAIFLCDPSSLDLYPIVADGPSHQHVMEMRVPLAERLTGWVAAYKTSVWNSDAALDMDSALRPNDLAVASALPLIREDAVVGVLSIYGKRGQDVSLAQRRGMEAAALPISEALWDAIQRGPQGIDGRRPDVRAAALSTLEAALSHSSSERLDGTVTIAYLRAIASDGGRMADIRIESALRLLLAGLLANQASRQCVVLSDTCLALYDDSAASPDSVRVHTNTIMATTLLQPYALEITRVTNSLDLQVLVQKVLEHSSRDTNDQGVRRVH